MDGRCLAERTNKKFMDGGMDGKMSGCMNEHRNV